MKKLLIAFLMCLLPVCALADSGIGGNAPTATALAANGANCSAGEYALGVDASGAVESCTDATTEINAVINGAGGTNLTCASQSCDVDDAFIVNNASDTMTGTLTADGLTLGANENLTLGAQTLDHNGTDFVFNDALQVTDRININTTSTEKFIEVNQGAVLKAALRATWNDADGAAATYADIAVNASGHLYLLSSAAVVSAHNLYPYADNTYYLGRNDDDAPQAWKGVILKDTNDGKYYRIQLTNGAIDIVDLTD